MTRVKYELTGTVTYRPRPPLPWNQVARRACREPTGRSPADYQVLILSGEEHPEQVR
jgi:hypothetical protein